MKIKWEGIFPYSVRVAGRHTQTITIVDDQLWWSSLNKNLKMTNDEFPKQTFQEDQM